MFIAATLRLAGLTLLVLFALRAILAPSLAFVLLSVMRFLISGAAKHCDGCATVLPLRAPVVQRYLRTTLAPLRAHTCLSDRTSQTLILYLCYACSRITTMVDSSPATMVPDVPIKTFVMDF